MLILTRQVDEEIVIGNDIRIRVVGIHRGQVRLGIEAPENLAIFRSELYEEIAAQNSAAARVSPEQLRAVLTERR